VDAGRVLAWIEGHGCGHIAGRRISPSSTGLNTIGQNGRGGCVWPTCAAQLPLQACVFESFQPQFLLHLPFPEPLRVVLLALEQEPAPRVLERRQVVLDILTDHALERSIVGTSSLPVCACKVFLIRLVVGRSGAHGTLEGVGSVRDCGSAGEGRFVPASGRGRRRRVGGDDRQRTLPVRIRVLCARGRCVLALQSLPLLQFRLGCERQGERDVKTWQSVLSSDSPRKRFSSKRRTCSGVSWSCCPSPPAGGGGVRALADMLWLCGKERMTSVEGRLGEIDAFLMRIQIEQFQPCDLPSCSLNLAST
jgi:hypothetical protein